MSARPREILRVERVAVEPAASPILRSSTPTSPGRSMRASSHRRAAKPASPGSSLKGRATDVYVGGYATVEDGPSSSSGFAARVDQPRGAKFVFALRGGGGFSATRATRSFAVVSSR